MAALQTLGNLGWPNSKRKILVNFLGEEDIEKTKQTEFVAEVPKNNCMNNDWASS